MSASGPGPGRKVVLIQVFGREDSSDTRAALRFFKERRLEVHFIDLRRKAMAPGELRRFIERLGPVALADSSGQAWKKAGLQYMRMTEAELGDRLLAEQRLLRLPLVRIGGGYAAGRDPASWTVMLVPS